MPSDKQSYIGSAPGKVILCGEYAVLESHPAIVLAVDRRIRARLAPTQGAPGVCIKTPGLSSTEDQLAFGHHGVEYGGGPHAMLVKIFNALLDHHGVFGVVRERAWHLQVDSRAFFSGRQKLGLGSSAAMTVALDAMFRSLRPTDQSVAETPATRWAYLHEIHSQAQGKRGSGADIAAALHGGSIIFMPGPVPSCEVFRLPQELKIAFIWSGASASTPSYLASLAEWRNKAPERYAAHMAAMGEAMRMLREGADVTAGVTRFTEALRAFADDSGLAIYAAGHTGLAQVAECYPGLLYKPCGAGGGDLGLALTTEADQLREFVREASERGCPQVTLAIDGTGAETKTETITS